MFHPLWTFVDEPPVENFRGWTVQIWFFCLAIPCVICGHDLNFGCHNSPDERSRLGAHVWVYYGDIWPENHGWMMFLYTCKRGEKTTVWIEGFVFGELSVLCRFWYGFLLPSVLLDTRLLILRSSFNWFWFPLFGICCSFLAVLTYLWPVWLYFEKQDHLLRWTWDQNLFLFLWSHFNRSETWHGLEGNRAL